MIEIRNLTKRFGSLTAVDDVSFDVGRGEVLGFLGPNGAGKSTTMKMVTGFLAPDGGTIRIGGLDVASDPVEVKRWIGYLPEGGAALRRDDGPRVPALHRRDPRAPGSGGPAPHRFRDSSRSASAPCSRCRSIPSPRASSGASDSPRPSCTTPHILILDEPTDGLDPNQKHEVRTLIRGMSAEKVIVLSTHILEEVDAVCTRATIIANGRIVSDGTPEELLRRSRMHNALRLGLVVGDAGSAGVVETLKAVPGVALVEVDAQSGNALEVMLFPAGGVPLAGPAGEAARANGWEVTELHVERGRLDDVFRAITVGEGGANHG